MATSDWKHASAPGTDDRFFGRRAAGNRDDEAGDKALKIEPAVEAIGKGAQVLLGVLAVVQRVDRASQRGLELALDGVDPLEL